MSEQRAHIRKLVEVEAMLADASGALWRPTTILDVSRIGVAFSSVDELEAGSSWMLRFTLPGSTRRNEAVVAVVHSSTRGVASGYRVGARFIAIDSAATDLIARFTAS